MIRSLKGMFSFPRPDLEGHWWHRMAKVVIAISTIALIIFSIHLGNEVAKPYDVFSFQNDFNKYSSTYRVQNCSIETLCGSDVNSVVFDYEVSGLPGSYEYVSSRDVHESYLKIFQELESAGAFNDLKAVDLQNNFYGDYLRILYVILLPVFWYLLIVQVVYRAIIYILLGKKQTKPLRFDTL